MFAHWLPAMQEPLSEYHLDYWEAALFFEDLMSDLLLTSGFKLLLQ